MIAGLTPSPGISDVKKQDLTPLTHTSCFRTYVPFYSKLLRPLGRLWSLEDGMGANPSQKICFTRDLKSKTITLGDSTLPDVGVSFNFL